MRVYQFRHLGKSGGQPDGIAIIELPSLRMIVRQAPPVNATLGVF